MAPQSQATAWQYDIGQINLASLAVAKVRMKFWHGGCEAILAIDVKACFGCHRWSSLYGVLRGEMLRESVSWDPRRNLVKSQFREKGIVAEGLFFFLCSLSNCVWRGGVRKGRKGEGRLHGTVKAR